MRALTRRLIRLIWKTKGQFTAIASVVAVGVTVYIAMSTAFLNLEHSRDLFYKEMNFADYYFRVVRAPEAIKKTLETLPGVSRVTARITRDIALLRPDGEKISGRLISYPLPLEGEVNRLKVLSGRLFEKHPRASGIEVLVDPQFARANGLSPGDSFALVIEGEKYPVTVVGTAIGPEFIYPLKDTSTLLHDPSTFGIIMLPLNQAQALLNLPAQVNEVVLTLLPGAEPEEVEKKVKEILEPYGNVASYPRKQQLSHAILDAELKQLQTSSRTLPTIFLLVASAIEFFVCGRMVRSQRQVIGTLKALGYTDREIILHYAGYSLAISLTGTLAGSLLGAFLASLLSQVYAMYFNLPHTIGGLNLKALVAGPALALSTGLAAGVLGSRGVVAVHPARAMRSEAPVQAKPVFLERVKLIWERFDSLWKLSLRRALRYKGRLLLETLGVALAVALLVLSLFFNDCMDYLLKQHFQEDNSYDFLARFSASLRDHEARNLERLPGVIRVEPILEVPIRIRFRGESEDGLLVGLPGELTLKKVRDSDGRRLDPPESGLLLPQGVAAKMGVKPGDRVRVETTLERGKKREVELRVVGVHAEMVGKNSYVSLKEAGTVLGERGIFNAALLKVEPGREPETEKAMANLDALSSLTSRERDLQGLKKQLGALILFTGIMIAFSFILGFTMVYSSATVSFSESVREMGVMRVMGFSQAEVAGLLFRETLVRCLGGAVVGLPLGKVLSLAYLKAVGTSDFFSLPAVVYPRTYALAALGGLLFVAVAHWSSARNVKKLELVEVLKAHD